MIWSLQLGIFCKKNTALFFYNGIHTSTVVFARKRIPRALSYEPGIRHHENILRPDTEFPREFGNEYDLKDDFDFTKTEEAYDSYLGEKKKHKKRIWQKIIAKKFFAPRPQPLMLTWNERQCIKHLHNEDPVQWNIKSLSESFPATPDTIKKILKSRIKITPERSKLLDMKAQKNWELLAEGKLDASPHVLEHLKKFINRKEVLLEQINKANYYLPEVKNEPVWNQGEMNKILLEYEKCLNKLVAEDEQNQNHKAISDGISDKKKLSEKKSSLDLVHEKIDKYKKPPELKDSFIFGKMINTFKENVTLEELENNIMKKLNKYEKLDLIEKAVSDYKLGKLGINSSENYMNINENNKLKDYKSLTIKNAEKEGSSFTPSLKESLKLGKKSYIKTDKKYSYDPMKIKSDKLISIDNRSQFIDETGIGKVIKADKSLEKAVIIKTKPEIDFSDPVRLQNEKVYYDQQVSDIKNTAFWNNNRGDQEKAIAESNKQPVEVPVYCNEKAYTSKTALLSADVYPERIKIPRGKQGSGLTFRVKDCYYDDDGIFLYRVPGMIK